MSRHITFWICFGFQGNIVRQFGPLDYTMLRFFRFFDSCNSSFFVLYLFPFPFVILGGKAGIMFPLKLELKYSTLLGYAIDTQLNTKPI